MVTGTAEKTKQATGGEAEGTKVLPVSGAGRDGKDGGAKTTQERMYPQSEVDALLGRAGQKIQAKLTALTAERDTFKTQAETLAAEITEAKASIAYLTKEIDTMSEDDPDKKGLVKLRREKEAELNAAKAERLANAAEKQEIEAFKRTQLVYIVADEHVTGSGEEVDKDSFRKEADKFRLDKRADLEGLAETMGLKPKDEVELPKAGTPAPTPYSGKTMGGGDNLASLSPKDRVKEVDRRLRLGIK